MQEKKNRSQFDYYNYEMQNNFQSTFRSRESSTNRMDKLMKSISNKKDKNSKRRTMSINNNGGDNDIVVRIIDERLNKRY